MAPGRLLAVFDVDGTVADARWRLPILGTQPAAASREAWARFFDAAGADPVIPAGVYLVRAYSADHDICWLTARSDRVHSLTAGWLEKHSLPTGELVMRPNDDLRPSPVWKLEQLRRIGCTRRIGIVVDDDVRVVEMAVEHGFPAVLAAAAAEVRFGNTPML